MQVPSAMPVGAAVSAAGAPNMGNLRVAQMNMWNLFDTVNDPDTGDDKSTPTPEQYQIKLEKIAKAVVELGTPDVISLNEIENETVVKDLLARPELKGAGYSFVVGDLNDGRGIRVGMLYKDARLEKVGVEQPNPKFSFPDGGRGQIDSSLLYPRAPLVVDFKVRGAAQASEGAALLTIAVNHFKSKLGGEGPEARRQMHGQYLGEWLDARQAVNPNGATIVLGDLNADYADGAYEKLANRADGSKRFHDAPLNLPTDDRFTYIYRGAKNMLDHVLIADDRKDAIKGVEILHVNTPKDARKSQWDPKVLAGFSDHDPTIVDLDLAKLMRPRS